MHTAYDPQAVEDQAQSMWQQQACFTAKTDAKSPFYCLAMWPYPSGELHMGHVRNYTISDFISRYKMMCGENVLQPMGWDAFGLPAENAAIKHGIHPHEWTQKNIQKMRTQFKRLGFAYDWTKEISTCDPQYYHWQQWLFLQMLDKGWAYRKQSLVNWDPVDQTVLANEQVIDGRGWRSGAPVEQRSIQQWFIKITDFADDLLDGLDTLTHWPEAVVTMQRNWIGKSSGCVVYFPLTDRDEKLEVYTTRVDTLFGVTFLALSPQHPLSTIFAQNNSDLTNFIHSCQASSTAQAVQMTMEKRGIDTGYTAIHPLTQAIIPIWITNYVLMEYGSGAVMGVPVHCQRDLDMANTYSLPCHAVIKQPDAPMWQTGDTAMVEPGILVNSDKFDGLTCEQAITAITQTLADQGMGYATTQYRLRDWGVSRQRYWGVPIPIVHCKYCGLVPVPAEQLPVQLPTDIPMTLGKSPQLSDIASFANTTCPQCNKPAQRETDTFDTFVDSSWYYARFTCPDEKTAILSKHCNNWLPVDQYIGGIEHATMHLLYARFMHKVLHKLQLVDSTEPFTRLLTQGMVLKSGHKMSKSKGNTVSPQKLIDTYGADTIRLFILFAAPPEQSLEWSDSGVEGAARYLKKLWHTAHRYTQLSPKSSSLAEKYLPARRQLHLILKKAQHDIEQQQFNTVVSACMKLLNVITDLDEQDPDTHPLITEALNILLRLQAPITPHICQVIWSTLGLGDNIINATWPCVDEQALECDEVQWVIQINGKLRARMTTPANLDQKAIEEQALKQEKIQSLLANLHIAKIIVVPKRLINIVTTSK